MKKLTSAQLKAARERILKLAGDIPAERVEKLSAAGFQSNSLPEKGKFDKVYWDDSSANKAFHHYRIKVADSDANCSLSCLKALITDTPEKFKETPKGFWVQDGLKAVNPILSPLSMLDVAALLEDQEFEATPVTYQSVRFLDGGYKVSPDKDKDLETKTTFKLTKC